MTRTILGVAIALGLLVSGALAQDYFSPFDAYRDIPVAGPHPCYPSSTPKTITATEYDRTLIVVYLCEDNRTVLRRFYRPNDQSVPPPVTSRCPGNFVLGTTGGCVPPDHPLAPKQR